MQLIKNVEKTSEVPIYNLGKRIENNYFIRAIKNDKNDKQMIVQCI